MKRLVAHYTSKLGGGAGVAVQRLHLALRRSGMESRIYFGEGQPMDSTTVPAFQNRSFFWRNMTAFAGSRQRSREAAGGYVTSPRWARRTPIHEFGEVPAVVNLHWVARWLDLPSFFASLPAGLPVVWSLHDLIPITGGCGYPGECDGFTRGCGNCPQLKSPHPQDASHGFFRAKEHWYGRINLHFVGNSEWTTSQVRRSGLVKYARSIQTIQLGIDPQQYKPVEKIAARKALGIPEGKFVIGFACLDFHERRKGAEILMEALKALPAREIILVVLGAGHWPASGIETIPLGSLNSPLLQSVFYSALDVLAMPSQIETFGLVALEAMACEIPVAAYPAGGLADVVADGETGLMEREVGSVEGLVRMLQWMLKHPSERAAMGVAARQRVVQKFSDILMAERYAALYNELMPAE